MAKQLAISTSTVRKNLEILSGEGLIEILRPSNRQAHLPASYIVLEVEKRRSYTPQPVGVGHPDVSASRSEVGATRPPNNEERLTDFKTNTSRSSKPDDEEISEVEAVYAAYPRHVGKRNAIQAIEKAADVLLRERKSHLNSRLNALSFLKERASAFAASRAGQRGQMTPHPATWFERGSYMDDPEEWEYLNDYELKQATNQREANVGVFRPW